MAIQSHLEKFLEGSNAWNAWRAENPEVRPDLADVNFESLGPEPYDILNLREFEDYDLSNCNLNRISARNCTFLACRFSGSAINFSDLCFSWMQSCHFDDVEMRVTRLGSAEFTNCSFYFADLSYCTAEETSFIDCKFVGTQLNHCSLVKTKFCQTLLQEVCVYGTSVWDVDLSEAKQSDIFIREGGVGISVPSIELAQFVALLLDNRKVRDFIETLTSKMVLILGRFAPHRKQVLDNLKEALSECGYLPVIFDFENASTRDERETVRTLASLSRFVIADLSEPKSVPLELESIIPQFLSLPVQPIIAAGEKPFSMLSSLARYGNLLPLVEYVDEVDEETLEGIIAHCESWFSNQVDRNE